MEGAYTDKRRHELDVDDEEGLLQLQEQFLAGQATSQPAARVTRISRKPQQQQQQQTKGPVVACGSEHQAHEQQQQQDLLPQPGAQQPSPQPAEQMCPVIPGILTDVRERDCSSTQPPAPPAADAAAAAAFPKAVHRKQSKFALGRRKQHAGSDDSAHLPAGQAAAAGQSPQPPPAARRPPAAAAAAGPPPLAAAAAGQDGTSPAWGLPASTEATAVVVDKANLQRIAEMSAEEVQEAQAEITQRFPPAVLEHLRKRHAAKQQQLQAAQAAQVAGQEQPAGRGTADSGAVATAAAAASTEGAAVGAAGSTAATGAGTGAAGLKKGFLGARGAKVAAAAAGGATGSSNPPQESAAAQAAAAKASGTTALKKGFLGKKSATHQSQQQAASVSQRAAAKHLPAAADQAATTTAPLGPLPAVARLRFSIHGQVLELAGPETPPSNPEEVLMRDNISRAAGVVPEGYTLPDIGVLVRSRHGPHRAVGFKMLATVLRRAQPLVYHVGPDGDLIPQPVLLDVQQQQQEQDQEEGQGSSSTGVFWADVWQYAVVALRAVMLCRLGLDEDNAQVLPAAADALRVLLGRSSSELLCEEVAASSSSLSWPLSWRGQLRRLDAAGGAWDSVENLVKAAQQGDAAPGSSSTDDASSLPDTAEDLAAIDPLAGFLATDPLPRIRFLLQQHKHNTELAVCLVSVLEAAAAASKPSAEAVVRARGLTAALIGLLDLGPLGGSNSSSSVSSGGGGSVGGRGSSSDKQTAAAAGLSGSSCRVAVLRLLRLLCAASPLNTQLLRTAGLETAVQLLLCINSNSTLSSSSNVNVTGNDAPAPVLPPAAAPAAGGGAAVSNNTAVTALLEKLEALRIWRVAAAQGVTLCHVEVMFPYMAALLQPPLGTEAMTTGSSSSSSGKGQAAVLQWQVGAEAFQLLEVLLRHALKVSAGDKTLGREMLTPGCAAAVAAAAAADWLHPRAVVVEAAQRLVSLSDCQLPYSLDPNRTAAAAAAATRATQSEAVLQETASAAAASEVEQGSSSSSSCNPYSAAESAAEAAALERVVCSLHPALLLPSSVSVVCALAAVLQYLAAYWATLEKAVPRQLAQELQQQLEGVGLWGTRAPDAAAAAAGARQAGSCRNASSVTGSRSSSVGAQGAASSSSSSSSSAAAAAAAALQGCRDDLTKLLLTQHAASSAQQQQQQQHQQQLGQAFLQCCLGLLQAAGPAAAGGVLNGHGAVRVHGMDDLLSMHAMSSAAAVMLLAVCELQQQLKHQQQHSKHQQQQQQQHSKHQQQQQQQQREDVNAPGYGSHLVARVCSVVSSNTLLWVRHAGKALVLEPWRMVHYTLRQYQLRLLLKLAPIAAAALQPSSSSAAAAHSTGDTQTAHTKQQETQDEQQQQQQEQEVLLMWQVVDALLGVLPVSAPGQEVQALQALHLLFSSSQETTAGSAAAGVRQLPLPSGVLSAAAAAIQQLQSQGGPLAAAAAGLKADTLPPSCSDDKNPTAAAAAGAAGGGAGEVPYPAPAILDGSSGSADTTRSSSSTGKTSSSSSQTGAISAACWCRVLLQGYVVTWLSVIADTLPSPAQEQQQQQQQGEGASAAAEPDSSSNVLAASKAHLSLPQVYVAENEGSRLPAPPEWLLAEIHAVPDPAGPSHSSTSNASSSKSGDGNAATMHPAAAALLLALGLQHSSDRSSSSYIMCLTPGSKLEALLKLMYCFDVWELLPLPTGDQQQQQQQQQLEQQQLEPAWQDAAARWASAVLSEAWVKQVLLLQQQGGNSSGSSSAGRVAGGTDAAPQDLYPCQVTTALQQAAAATSAAAGNQQPRRQQQQQQFQLFPRWSVAPAAAQVVDRLVVDLSEVSFGDPLFGAHVALLLLPAAGGRLQRTAWGTLAHLGALHLLPPPWRCIGGSQAYIGVDVSSSSSSDGSSDGSDGSSSGSSSQGFFAGFDVQLVGDMAKSLAQGDLSKAVHLRGLTSYLALHGIAALGLDQRAWREQRGGGGAAVAAAVDAVSRSDGDHHQTTTITTTAAATDAAMAVNIVRGVLRACPVETLQLLVAAGRVRGLSEEEEGRALVQAAHGDAVLMDKVRRLMSSAH